MGDQRCVVVGQDSPVVLQEVEQVRQHLHVGGDVGVVTEEVDVVEPDLDDVLDAVTQLTTIRTAPQDEGAAGTTPSRLVTGACALARRRRACCAGCSEAHERNQAGCEHCRPFPSSCHKSLPLILQLVKAGSYEPPLKSA